jgi:cytochrome c-type biogenesis protein CcmF
MTAGAGLLWIGLATLAGAVVGPRRWIGLLAPIGSAAVTAAVLRLAIALVGNDWTSAYVAANSRAGAPVPLRVAGLWAGPEGSLLLWTAMTGWAAVIASRLAPERRRAAAVRVGAAVCGAYLLVVVVVADPFQRLDVPAIAGRGLEPVLEHPAMIWHPPVLYAGLIGMLVPGILGAAAVIGGEGSTAPVPARLLGVPLGLLTFGLVSGAAWAAVELGWGGYWAWDPIESSGLVVWLCGAAALHAAGRPDSRGDGVIGSVPVATALVLAPAVGAVWATTLTRIGVIPSVHAFADLPGLRSALVTVAALATAGALVTIMWSRRRHRSPATVAHPGRRVAVVALAAAGALVALGTYEPLIEAATSGDSAAITGRYYTLVLWPVVVAAGVLMVISERRRWPPVLGAIAALALVPWSAGPFALAVAVAGGAAAGLALAATASRWTSSGPGRRLAGPIAHLGVGISLIGMAGTMATTEEVVAVGTGAEAATRAGPVEHHSIELRSGSGTGEAVATVTVDGHRFRPRLVDHTGRGVSTVETATRFDGLDQLQVVLLDGNRQHARYRVSHLPRIGLLWVGAGLVATGAALTGLAGRTDRPTITPDQRSPLTSDHP